MHTAASLEKCLKKFVEKTARFHQRLDEADRNDVESGEVAVMEGPDLAVKLQRGKNETELKNLQDQLVKRQVAATGRGNDAVRA